MNDIMRVELADRKRELRCKELHLFLAESFVLFFDFVELSARHEGHHKVDAKIVLEHVVHTY